MCYGKSWGKRRNARLTQILNKNGVRSDLHLHAYQSMAEQAAASHVGSCHSQYNEMKRGRGLNQEAARMADDVACLVHPNPVFHEVERRFDLELGHYRFHRLGAIRNLELVGAVAETGGYRP